MARSFSQQVLFDGKKTLAVIVPQLRKDGMHYEINVPGYPRFFMAWSALGRYDSIGDEAPLIPYPLVLAISDLLAEEVKRKK